MNMVGVVVVVVLAIFAASMLGAWLRGGGSQGDTKAIREDLQRLLTTQAQGFSAQMGQVTQLVTQQLSEVRRDLEQGVTTTGRITTDAQREMTEQLRSSADVLTQLNQHLGEVQQSGRELTEAAKTMQTVLGRPKSPGVIGEAQLQDLLSDVLPGSAYEFNHHFATGGTATAVVHAGRKLVAIDTRFPLDSFRAVAEKGDKARAGFAQAVREHVDQVAESLIAPEEGTLDLALMFVPSESAFIELLRTNDGQERLDDYCREKRVLPVSPNSLHAYLGAVLIGLRGVEFEENSKRLLASLEGVKQQFEAIEKAHEEIGGQIEQAAKTHEDAGRQLAQTREALDALTASETAQEAETDHDESEEPVGANASKNGA